MNFTLGFVIPLCIFLWISISSGIKAVRQDKTEKKAEGSSSMVVAGAIIGTLVGGSSTIGTAQLAYSYGFSAWWFTLGAGIACLVLAVVYTKPFREKCGKTLTGIIGDRYGSAVGMVASGFSCAGMYINIIAQLISASSIVMIILPETTLLEGVLISAVLMILYALSGGVNGVGKIGVFKTVLLYLTTIGGGLLAIRLSGGLQELIQSPVLQDGYFGLFNRGFGKDLGNGISVVLGVLSTQSYAQAILAGKSDETAKKGALVSACLIPPIGIGGILIGMYMRVQHPDLVSTKFALPMFIQENFPPAVAGVIFATLLITVLGTGAGLALGIGTTIRQDFILKNNSKSTGWVKKLLTERKIIVLILVSTAMLASGGIGSFILDYSFMSMALRAAAIFVPLQWILFGKGKLPAGYILGAVISGPLVVFFGNLIRLSFDPLFLGIFSSALVTAVGFVRNNRKMQ